VSFCHHAIVGVILVHQGRIATAMRQKPPLNRAPSAGHVEPGDGLPVPFPLPVDSDLSTGRLYRWTYGNAAFERCAVREGREETGFLIEPGSLRHLLTWKDGYTCPKTGAEGKPGGRHIWQVFAHKIEMISQPTLTDEPGKMHGWDFRSIGTLLADPILEPIWFDLLTEIRRKPESSHGLELA
jgi:8-oxo-dGTP pyrophosphatase MutT (NUDIX family)